MDKKKYREKRQKIIEQFKRGVVGDTEKHMSPCGKYRLEITQYGNGKGYWNYTRGRVFDVDDNLLADIMRNYSHFWYLFTEDYFLCGEDYQGYSIVDLDSKKKYDYFPDEGYAGAGFCWIYVNRVNDTLEVIGCIWAGPEEKIIYDFSKPLALPYPEISREFYIDPSTEIDAATVEGMIDSEDDAEDVYQAALQAIENIGDHFGIYSKAIEGGASAYKERDDFQNGWNAAFFHYLNQVQDVVDLVKK